MTASLLAALLLGLRHGADPDHLAAIDNLTRSSASSHPRSSKFVGTLFAAGHTVMILAIAAVIGAIGERFTTFGAGLERTGTWLSVVVLIVMAMLNVRRLLTSSEVAPVGLRTRLFASLMRRGNNVLVALPVGFLFGIGFETSSQIAAFVVFASGRLTSALAIGVAFCIGMILTDTSDSVLVARLVRDGTGIAAARTWIWAVTLLAIGVALYEMLGLLGYRVPLSELAFSGILVLTLLVVFGYLHRDRLQAAFRP